MELSIVGNMDCTGFHKTGKCGWCEEKIEQTDAQYLLKGNICPRCVSKIANIIKDKLDNKEHD